MAENSNEMSVVKSHDVIMDSDYLEWISELKQRYMASQVKAAVKVNSEALLFIPEGTKIWKFTFLLRYMQSHI